MEYQEWKKYKKKARKYALKLKYFEKATCFDIYLVASKEARDFFKFLLPFKITWTLLKYQAKIMEIHTSFLTDKSK